MYIILRPACGYLLYGLATGLTSTSGCKKTLRRPRPVVVTTISLRCTLRTMMAQTSLANASNPGTMLNNNGWYVQNGRIISTTAQQQNVNDCPKFINDAWTEGGGPQAGMVNGQDYNTFAAAQTVTWWKEHYDPQSTA